MKNKRLSLFFILVLSLFLVASLVFESRASPALEKISLGDETVRIQSGAGPVIDIQLLENTDVCLTDCHAILKFTPHVDIELPASPDSEFKWDFMKEKPYMKGLASHHFEILSNVSYNVSVPIYENKSYESTCYNPDNTSYKCTKWGMEQTGSKIDTRYRDEFIPFTFWSNTMEGGKEYIIKLSGKKRAALSKNNVDWIPTIKGIPISEWEWWNSNWIGRKPVSVNVSTGENYSAYPVLMNISYESDMLANFSDIRWTTNCSDDAEEIYFFRKEKVDSYYAKDWVRVPETNTTLCMYYGNPGAGESTYNNWSRVLYLYEDFEDGDWSYNPNWTLVAGDPVQMVRDNYMGSTSKVGCIGTNDNDPHTIYMRTFLHNASAYNSANEEYRNLTVIYDFADNLTGSVNYHMETLASNTGGGQYQTKFSDYQSTTYWWVNETNLDTTANSYSDGTWRNMQWWINGTDWAQSEVTGHHFSGTDGNVNKFDWFLLRVTDTDTDSGDWACYDNITIRKYMFPEPTYNFGEKENYCIEDDTYINEDTTLPEGLYCNVTDTNHDGVLIINASDMVLDCNGLVLNGTDEAGSYGIYVYNNEGFENVTIKNCGVINFNYGADVIDSNNISFINSNVSDNSYDIRLQNSTYVEFINSTMEVTEIEPDGSYLERRWYVRVNVTNQTDPLEDAVVSFYDKYDNLKGTKNTSSDGMTDEFIITQYLENYSGKYNYTPHNISVTHPEYASKNQSETINISKTVHILLAKWNITFNVTSGEDGSEQDNVNIYCNYTYFNQGGDTDNPYGPFKFPPGSWQCTFEKTTPLYYNKTIVFTVNNDATIDVVISLKGELTNEEHAWLEEIYRCLYEGNCLALNLLLDINQTTTKTWNQFRRTDQSIVSDEDFISKVVNDTNNVTINYTVNVPAKEGYGLIEGIQGYDDFLPIRIHYWFLDETNTSCYSQGNYSVAMAEPYCKPLTVYTVGQINTQIDFTVDLRPSLPEGNYTIVRDIEIDPDNVWIDYGHEIIGQIQVMEEGMEAFANVKGTGKVFADESEGQEKQEEVPGMQSSEDRTTGMIITEQVNVFYFVLIIISILILIFAGLTYKNSRDRTPWRY